VAIERPVAAETTWTRKDDGGLSGASTSAPIIPTAVEIPPSSPKV
jgi:hypothetical protein